MKPRLPALAVLLALIAFSGCVSVDVFHQVNRDGSSLMVQKMDFSDFPATANMYGTSSPAEFCQKMMDDNPGLGCAVEGQTVWLDKTVGPDDGLYIFNRTLEFPYSIYRLEVRKTPVIVSAKTEGEIGSEADVSDFKDPSARPTANMLRAAGIRASYMVRMPGEIVSAENGDILLDVDGGRYAKYDVLRLMDDGRYMIVTSKELDLVAVGTVIAAIGLFIGGIGVALVLREAAPKKKSRKR